MSPGKKRTVAMAYTTININGANIGLSLKKSMNSSNPSDTLSLSTMAQTAMPIKQRTMTILMIHPTQSHFFLGCSSFSPSSFGAIFSTPSAKLRSAEWCSPSELPPSLCWLDDDRPSLSSSISPELSFLAWRGTSSEWLTLSIQKN